MSSRQIHVVNSRDVEIQALSQFPGTGNVETHLFPLTSISKEDYVDADDLDLLVKRGEKSAYLNTAMQWVGRIYTDRHHPAVPVVVDNKGNCHLLGRREIVSAYDYAGKEAVPVIIVNPDTTYMN